MWYSLQIPSNTSFRRNAIMQSAKINANCTARISSPLQPPIHSHSYAKKSLEKKLGNQNGFRGWCGNSLYIVFSDDCKIAKITSPRVLCLAADEWSGKKGGIKRWHQVHRTGSLNKSESRTDTVLTAVQPCSFLKRLLLGWRWTDEGNCGAKDKLLRHFTSLF